MTKRISVLLTGLFILGPGLVSAESFNDYLKSQQDNTKNEYQQFRTIEDDEFTAYKKQLLLAFKQYKQSVATVWGKNNSLIPTNMRDVSYQNDLKQRSIIDYETGRVKVELALTPKEANNPEIIRKKMHQALATTLNRGSDKRSIIEIAKKPSTTRFSGAPLLLKMVKNNSGKVLSKASKNQFIKTQSKKLSVTKTRGTDNQPRVIVSTSFAMISGHLKARAIKFKSPVKKYSKVMKLPQELVYAIMETESAFNPNARSSVPAFGLMQLVPTSGARDAYRLLFNKDKVVTDRYLYNPDNNIKLGTAFIHKLYYSYLKGIKNPEARTWATIAAYNTGAGNVFNTFAGKYRKSKFGNRSNWKNKALSIINNKAPEQVYQYLKRNLPHKETRHYIQNIRKRIPKYKSL